MKSLRRRRRPEVITPARVRPSTSRAGGSRTSGPLGSVPAVLVGALQELVYALLDAVEDKPSLRILCHPARMLTLVETAVDPHYLFQYRGAHLARDKPDEHVRAQTPEPRVPVHLHHAASAEGLQLALLEGLRKEKQG